MKTLKQTPIVMILMLVATIAMTACGSKNDNNATTALACTTTPTTGYSSGYNTSYYGNGYGAYGSTAGTYYYNGSVVQSSQCATVNGVTNPYYNNTTTAVANNTILGYYNGIPVQNCTGGQYYNPNNGGSGICGGINYCSGALLVNQQTGQRVYCQ